MQDRTRPSVNFYKRYIGDYLRDTLRLSMIQDGAYGRLIDVYYAEEKPLPLKKDEIYQMARATSKAEREAVDTVLDRFFKEMPDGYHHKRIDEEIGKAKASREGLAALHDSQAWRRFRDLVLERDGYRCVYCGAQNVRFQLDHVVPRSKGGSDDPSNLATACGPCNASKGAKLLADWRGR